MVRRLIWWQKAKRSPPFPAESKDSVGLSGISTSFEVLSQIIRQIIYALLTRAPLNKEQAPYSVRLACEGTPPAFVLSQDQTLQLNYWYSLITQILMLVNITITTKCYSVFKDQIQTTNRQSSKSVSGCQYFISKPGNFFCPSQKPATQKGLVFYHDWIILSKKKYTLNEFYFWSFTNMYKIHTFSSLNYFQL